MSINLVLILVALGYLSFVFLAESVNPFHRPDFRGMRRRLKLGRQVGLLVAVSSMASMVLPADNLIVQLQYCLFFVSPVVILLLCKHFLWRRKSVKVKMTSRSRLHGASHSVGHEKQRPSGKTREVAGTPRWREIQMQSGDHKSRGLQRSAQPTPKVSRGPSPVITGVDNETGESVDPYSVFDDVPESELITRRELIS